MPSGGTDAQNSHLNWRLDPAGYAAAACLGWVVCVDSSRLRTLGAPVLCDGVSQVDTL